jgi:tRNA1(Val) A37 N6-methylase TrmN6
MLHFLGRGYTIISVRKKQDIFTILDGRVKMTDAGGYKTTEDAVLLARAAMMSGAAAGAISALDVGAGAGGVALCLLDMNPKMKMAALDVSEKMLIDAGKNAMLNNRTLELIHADIFKWTTARQFDLVVTNPPYFFGTPRDDAAHHNADVYEWTNACAKRLRARGRFFAIADAGVMDKVIAALVTRKCGGITVMRAGERVVIGARAGVKTPAKFLSDFGK